MMTDTSSSVGKQHCQIKIYQIKEARKENDVTRVTLGLTWGQTLAWSLLKDNDGTAETAAAAAVAAMSG